MIIKPSVYDLESITSDEELEKERINISPIQLKNIMELNSFMEKKFVTKEEFKAICSMLLIKLDSKHSKQLPYLTAPLLILTMLFVASLSIAIYFSYLGSNIGSAFLFPTVISLVTLLFLKMQDSHIQFLLQDLLL